MESPLDSLHVGRIVDTALFPEGSTLTLTASDPNVVRVFNGQFASSVPIIDPAHEPSHTWAYEEIPQEPITFLAVEGLASGSVTLTLALRNPEPDGSLICKDEVVVTVIGLDVRWYTYVGGQPGVLINDANLPDLDDQGNPVGGSPANVGYRYFPGATTQGGDWNKEVMVVVQTNPSVGGVPLWLKAFDPDDPSYDDEPVDDNGPDGDDNDDQDGGTISGSFEFSGETDAAGDYAGALVVVFRTAVQPGDNHRVAATLKQAALDVLTETAPPPGPPQTQFQVPAGDEEVPLFIGDLSPLLTVWRNLHVETDTMVRPTFAQNTWTMDWNEPREGSVATQVVFEVDDPFSEDPMFGGYQTQSGQFEQGFVELRDGPGNALVVARVVQYTNSEGGDDTVVINIADCGKGISGIECLGGVENGQADFSDDDLRDEALFVAGTWGCDGFYAGGASLLPPDLSALGYRYSPAYIEPVHEAAVSGIGGIPTFLRNVDFGSPAYGRALWDQARNARQLPVSTARFWTVMVASAWQAKEAEDRDPNDEKATGGVNTHADGATQAVWTLGSQYTGICAVFKAVKQAGALESDIPEGFTVAHEIGHTLGLPHNPVDDPDDPPIGLMDPIGDGQLLPFTPENVDRLRRYDGP